MPNNLHLQAQKPSSPTTARGTTALMVCFTLMAVGCEIHTDTDANREQVDGNPPNVETPTSTIGNGLFSPLPMEINIADPGVALGTLLFHDARLSKDNSSSCATCHDLSAGRAVGPINTPTVFNAFFNASQFWNGRSATLEKQMPVPVHNPLKMNTDCETAGGRSDGCQFSPCL